MRFRDLPIKRKLVGLILLISGIALVVVGLVLLIYEYRAARRDIVRLVVREGLGASAIGLGVGLAAAAALTRLMQGLLFGVTPLDLVSFLAAPVLLFAVATLACLLPAARAAATDPAAALRE